jgi:cytochrome c-type biogenesis protein CcmH/NrfG
MRVRFQRKFKEAMPAWKMFYRNERARKPRRQKEDIVNMPSEED